MVHNAKNFYKNKSVNNGKIVDSGKIVNNGRIVDSGKMVKNVPDHHRRRRLSNPILLRRIHVCNSNSGN
jgi:hypothetical protein